MSNKTRSPLLIFSIRFYLNSLRRSPLLIFSIRFSLNSLRRRMRVYTRSIHKELFSKAIKLFLYRHFRIRLNLLRQHKEVEAYGQVKKQKKFSSMMKAVVWVSKVIMDFLLLFTRLMWIMVIWRLLPMMFGWRLCSFSANMPMIMLKPSDKHSSIIKERKNYS